MGRGYPSLADYGLGERRKLPQRGPQRNLGQKWVLVHLVLERTHLIATNLTFLTFLRHIFSHIHIHSYY